MMMVKKMQTREREIKISDAAFPKPFVNGLEFNPPVRGTWNIVHVGMLIPEAHQIYVCAYNCLRGVVLTAAEMDAAERFSFVILEENDLIAGKLEEVTIEGVAQCLEKLAAKGKMPPLVLLFTVCVHRFLSCDLDYVYRKLAERFPSVFFARGYMDCLWQKTGPSPEQKLRRSMYDAIEPLPMKKGVFSIVGYDFRSSGDNDLKYLIESSGGVLREIAGLKTYDDYLHLGESETVIANFPAGCDGGAFLAERLGRKFFYWPDSFDYAEISRYWKILIELLPQKNKLPAVDETIEKEIDACEKFAAEAKKIIGEAPIAIDYTFHSRPLGLAKFLFERGFNVVRVYLDVISPEEEAAFQWLQDNVPSLILAATNQPEGRQTARNHYETIAFGQKAAWFEGTSHFVNVVFGGGNWGFRGIRKTLHLLIEAAQEEKDTQKLILQKGWSLPTCM